MRNKTTTTKTTAKKDAGVTPSRSKKTATRSHTASVTRKPKDHA